MKNTSIEWTDAVWNPVTGCAKVSEGCRNCYAETVAHRFWKDRKFTDVICHEDRLQQPLKWRKPRRVFVNSMSDLFHEAVPDEFIDKVFAVMALASRHTFQVLTKRPKRLREYMQDDSKQRSLRVGDAICSLGHEIPWGHLPLLNVHLGVSVEDQRTADERIPLLLETPTAKRFVSYEPALGPVDFQAFLPRLLSLSEMPGSALNDGAAECRVGGLDQIIIGGESGPNARPFDVQWARNTIGQCRAAAVACFVKQMGALPIVQSGRINHWNWGPAIGTVARFEHHSEIPAMWRVILKDRKGGNMAEWPEEFRVREMI